MALRNPSPGHVRNHCHERRGAEEFISQLSPVLLGLLKNQTCQEGFKKLLISLDFDTPSINTSHWTRLEKATARLIGRTPNLIRLTQGTRWTSTIITHHTREN